MTVKKELRDSPRAIADRRKSKAIAFGILMKEQSLYSPQQLMELSELSRATLYRRLKDIQIYKQHNTITQDNGDSSLPPSLPSPSSSIFSSSLFSLPSFINRNQHKQMFTSEQELILANNVRNIIDSKYRPINRRVFREQAQQYWSSLHSTSHSLRSIPPFRASDGWIARFKTRHGFSSGKMEYVKKVAESKKADLESAQYAYVCEVEEAVETYTACCVLNMDETPAKCCDLPGRAWKNKGSGREKQAQVSTYMPGVKTPGLE